jgi:hypothetical protein
MAEPKTREELEAEWWEAWWRDNFSWDGLTRRGIGGEYGSFKSKGPHGEGTLQDYWRRDPKTGTIRTDEEMLEVGELCRDGDDGEKLWHIAHVPLKWKSERIGKKAWIAAQKMKLYEILQLRLKNTEVSRDGVDGRAQFSGIVLDAELLLAASSEHGEPLKTARVLCKNGWFHSLDAKGTRFSEDTDFSGALVLGFADFREAYFEKQFIANSAFFCELVFFENSIFEGKVELRDTIFLELADFSNTNFKDQIKCDRSLFYGIADFNRVIFAGSTEFNFSIFRKETFFSSTEFQGPVHLVKTEFERESLFVGTKFLFGAYFVYTSFGKLTTFDKAEFFQELSFKGGVFSKGANFRGIKTWSNDPHLCSRAFFDVQTSGTMSFDAGLLPTLGAFSGLKLEKGALLSFDDPGTKATLASFSEQLSRIKEKLKNSPQLGKNEALEEANRLLDDLAGGCRVLKNYFESQGDRERAQRFFRLELEARMKSDEVGRLERLIFWAYKVLSDYGASIGRPLKWLARSVVFFWLSYWCIAATCLNPGLSHIKPNQESYSIQNVSEVMNHVLTLNFSAIDIRPMLGAANFSFHRAFPFGAWDVKAEDKDNNMRKLLLGDGEGLAHFTVRVLATIQSIFSIAMIFLSGLAIRRRFKMD